jgi:hypothetical protein
MPIPDSLSESRAPRTGPGEIAVTPDNELPEDERPSFNSAQHLDADSTRLRSELGCVEPVGLTNALWHSVERGREQE